MAVLVAMAVWFYTVFFPSPERAIRARLTQLAKSASFGGNESPVAAMANAQRAAGFFPSSGIIMGKDPASRKRTRCEYDSFRNSGSL